MRVLGQTARKSVVWWAVVVVGFLFIASPASLWAQEFPSKPITIIIPFQPGGLVDITCRILADRLSKELKVPVLAENMAGAAGRLAATTFLNRPPDGYTLLGASGAIAISAVLLSKTPAFDSRKDFLPLGYLCDAPVAMSVAKSAPFQTFAEFVKYAKANPGKVIGGTSALGGETNIMFEQIILQNKIDCKVVPYPDNSKLTTAILGGHVNWMTQTMPSTMPYQKSGDVKIVLLTRRAAELPDVPSGADVGLPDISLHVWSGVFAHSKTPKAVYDKLAAAVAAAAKDPEVTKKISATGATVDFKGPQDFSKLLNRQWDIYANIIKAANIQVE